MRLLLFTGKGGVGKTTASAATAAAAAARGSKTLVLSTDPAHSLADALGRPLTGEPTEVDTGLYAMQVDTQAAFERTWRDVHRLLTGSPLHEEVRAWALDVFLRLAEAEAVSSVGSRGDSYDNALAESVNGLYKAELINRHGPWRSVDEVELATARWVHFWNADRLHGACGDLPPAEFEAAYHSRLQAAGEAA